MKIEHPSDYAERRRKEYPPLADQIDAVLKGGADLADMRTKVQAVKDKYPKPVVPAKP